MTETKVPTLYIGTYDAEGNGSFQEFPFVSSGEVTPENLIAAMGELTGWDLTRVRRSGDHRQGRHDCIFCAGECRLHRPPEEQKDEFHMYSSDQLCYTIFDSIQKTLRENFSPENPEALDIYYCTDGSTEIELDNGGSSAH